MLDLKWIESALTPLWLIKMRNLQTQMNIHDSGVKWNFAICCIKIKPLNIFKWKKCYANFYSVIFFLTSCKSVKILTFRLFFVCKLYTGNGVHFDVDNLRRVNDKSSKNNKVKYLEKSYFPWKSLFFVITKLQIYTVLHLNYTSNRKKNPRTWNIRMFSLLARREIPWCSHLIFHL